MLCYYHRHAHIIVFYRRVKVKPHTYVPPCNRKVLSFNKIKQNAVSLYDGTKLIPQDKPDLKLPTEGLHLRSAPIMLSWHRESEKAEAWLQLNRNRAAGTKQRFSDSLATV